MTPAQRKIKAWRENPALFVYENFKVDPDPWQLDALERLGGSGYKPRRRVAMKACTGPGKSAVLAWGGWHRLTCFCEAGEHPKGVAISGEGRDNLRDNLWAELAKWQARSEFLKTAFRWTAERITAVEHPETWFLSARGYPKSAKAEEIGSALAGTHSRFPFALLDEIGRMPIVVGQKASQLFTGGVKDALIMAAGNPTSVDGLLYHISEKERELWDLITITADPDDPRRTPRVDIEHAREQIRLNGRDNPWVMSTILGLFPPGGINALFSVDEVEAAQARTLREAQYAFVEKRLGIDVALYGDDRTVLIPRQGLAVFSPEIRIMRTQEPADISAAAIDKFLALEVDRIMLDDTGGWGSGVKSHLKLAGYAPLGVQMAGKAADPRYYNKRAECWFRMRQHVRDGGTLPNLPEAVAEFTTTEYSMKDGKLLLQPKDLVKKRLGRSPDIADALSCTFALPDNPRGHMRSAPGSHQGKALTDYDPINLE